MYGNEAEVGEAIRRSGLDRGQVYVTSKLSNDAHRPGDARRAADESLKALGFGYLDLFLIHWPLPTRYDGDYVSTWSVLTEFYRDGRARSIGVSNFQPHHLPRLHGESEIIPAVDQIEVNPYLTQDKVRGFCAEHQIAVEAWAPPAWRHRLPKSVMPDRIRENIGIFDVGLSAAEVEAISALNRNERTGPDPDTFGAI